MVLYRSISFISINGNVHMTFRWNCFYQNYVTFFLIFLHIGRMDEMMRGQRGWRELAVLGDKIEKLSGMLEGFIWSPRSSEANESIDDWAFEEVKTKTNFVHHNCLVFCMLPRFYCMQFKLVVNI